MIFKRTTQPGQNGASTAAPLYTLLKIRNRVKTKDAHFVQDYWKRTIFPFFDFFLFSIFWIFSFLFFSDFFFFYFFGFFLFSIFLNFLFFSDFLDFLDFFLFSIFSFSIFFGFFFFYFFGFSFFSPHEDTYLIGLTIHKQPKTGFKIGRASCRERV